MRITERSTCARRSDSSRSGPSPHSRCSALVERERLGARGRARAVEAPRVDAALREQKAAQVVGLALDRGALHESVAQHDPAVPALRAQHQHPGLPGQAHDLENVREAEVLEAADETHPTPGRSPAGISLPAATRLQRVDRPAGA
jgi:hypothetical protein